MTDPSLATALPRSRRPANPLLTVRLEPREVRHHPREHVLHLIVLHCQWPFHGGDYRKGRATSWIFDLLSGSCVVVPDELTMAFTARHNLMGQKKILNRKSKAELVSFAPVWAIAISDSNFRAMRHEDMEEWSHQQWKAKLLHFGGRQAIKYKTTTPADVLLRTDTGGPRAHTELCMLYCKDNLAGAVNTVSRFTTSLLDDRETLEVIQIGFPGNYCTNPKRKEWVPPLLQEEMDVLTSFERGWSGISDIAPLPSELLNVLQWCSNVDSEQTESKFYCRTEDVMAGQGTYTLRLPCTIYHGDSGGAVYLVMRDTSLRGKKKFSLLGVTVRGLSDQHVSFAWPVNDATESLLDGAVWQDFLPEGPAAGPTNPNRLSALAGGASTSQQSIYLT